MFLSDARRDQVERAELRRLVCRHCTAAPCDREPRTCEVAAGLVGGMA